MCRHFKKKRYNQQTFLLCLTADEKNQKETICTSLKTLHQKAVCTDINAFEKALVQRQERVKKDWRTCEKFLLHRKAFLNSQHKKLSNKESAVLIKHDYNPPFMEIKPKQHMLICDDCQGSSVYTQA